MATEGPKLFCKEENEAKNAKEAEAAKAVKEG